MEKETVSVILPVYNEEKVLKRSVESIKNVLEKMPNKYEIIISEDGSTDRTAEIAKSLECGAIRALNNRKRKGKGAAIKHATERAKGNVIIFMDADLASHPSHVINLVKMFNSGASIVVASRYHKDSKVRRTPIRHFASRSFNFLVKMLLGSKLSDHQCGFKAFRKDLVLPLMSEVEDKRWFWDTELLVRAQRRGLKIVEIPIEWNEERDSKFRLFEDTLHMFYSLVSFKLKGK
jgi:glycosyltransferase involved in cell wall biosynthesis